jgi:hypothetical protein
VLPKGFVKIRYFGFFASNRRTQFALLKKHLEQDCPLPSDPSQSVTQLSPSDPAPQAMPCPVCGKPMTFLRSLAPLACVVPRPSTRSP